MTSTRQIDANRRNAQASTGPVTTEGKQHSRRNALRHGLTAETIIGALEDAEDYAAFEMAVTADFEGTSAVERELVLRLASLLWRLRRATAIESGLFSIHAKHLLQFRQNRKIYQDRQKVIDELRRTVGTTARAGDPQETAIDSSDQSESAHLPPQQEGEFEDLTRSFVRLTNLPTYPLDRLSRYEARLWRQAGQILFALQFVTQRKLWTGSRIR